MQFQRGFENTLHSAEGQEITEAGEIGRTAVKFYSELYQREYEDHDLLFASIYDGLQRNSAEENPGRTSEYLQGIETAKSLALSDCWFTFIIYIYPLFG